MTLTNVTGQVSGQLTVSNNVATAFFAGRPGWTYTVQRSTNLLNWTTIWTTNAPGGGLFHFTEEAIEHTIARSEGRPLKLQMICADVLRYKYAMRSLRRRITLADIRAALAYAEEQSRRQAAANKEAA